MISLDKISSLFLNISNAWDLPVNNVKVLKMAGNGCGSIKVILNLYKSYMQHEKFKRSPTRLIRPSHRTTHCSDFHEWTIHIYRQVTYSNQCKKKQVLQIEFNRLFATTVGTVLRQSQVESGFFSFPFPLGQRRIFSTKSDKKLIGMIYVNLSEHLLSLIQKKKKKKQLIPV